MPFWNNKADIDDLETRSEVAKNCKEGVDPRSALGDWGDHDEDHSKVQHLEATVEWGVTNASAPQESLKITGPEADKYHLYSEEF